MSKFSRRRFLEIGAAAAGASLATKTTLLNPLPLLASPRPVSASDRVHFGMIGVGMQGSQLLGQSIELPGVACVAACDLYNGRHTLAREITDQPNLPVTRRYHELLANKDIDCIVAAVPDHWHKQVVVDAVSAGKDIYCEKPMSHSAADGVEMVAAAQKTGRIVQIGSQRVSSLICAKARELVSQGMLGDMMLVEGWLGRNDPTGAWEYPPPTDLSPDTLDWDTWQGTVPKRAFDPYIFARWRCWKEYGTGLAGDLLVHLVSGMMFMLDMNEAPRQATAIGGIRRWKDGRNMPDVQASLFYYGDLPVYMRLNQGTEMPETYRIQGSKGILEVTEFGLSYTPQTGRGSDPVTTTQDSPARCAAPTRSSGTRRMIRSWVTSPCPRRWRSGVQITTTSSRTCGPFSRLCVPASPSSKMSSSATMRHLPATWRMNLIFARPPFRGMRPRRASKADPQCNAGTRHCKAML